MQKKIKSSVLIFVLVLPFFFLVDFYEVFNGIINFSLESVFFAFLLYLVFFFLNAFALVFVMKRMGYSIPIFGGLGVNQLSSLFNYIAPFRVGQFAVKSLLMKTLFNVPFSVSAIGFVFVSVISLCSSVIYFIAIVLFSANEIKEFYIFNDHSVIILFLVPLGLACIFFILNKRKVIYSGRLEAFFNSLSCFSLYDVLICVAIFLIQVLLGSLITIVFLQGVGVSISLITAMLLSSAANITLLVSLTPGNIGAKELTFVGIGLVLGVPESPMLAALIADRVLQIIISSVFSVIFSFQYAGVVKNIFKG